MIRSRKKNGILEKIAGLFLALLVLFSGVFSAIPRTVAFADNENLAFDSTSVNDDLGSTVDLSEWPKDENGTFKLYTFVEYGYAESAFDRGNFALYLYVYNPAQLQISRVNNASSVNLAVEYELNDDGTFATKERKFEGDVTETVLSAVEYRNFGLKFCGETTGENERLFVKFRVLDVADVLKNVLKMDAEGYGRRYDVAGVQLFTSGAETAIDYGVSKTVVFDGYAKGLGAGAELESTLTSRYFDLETVTLDVKHTYYRTQTSSLGEGHQNQLDTVYFAVPKRLFETYGALQRIKAEWYEYKTKEIVVTSHDEFYDEALQHIGEVYEDFTSGTAETLNGGEYGLAVNPKAYAGFGNAWSADWKWNINQFILGTEESTCDSLHYLFPALDISNYDPYGDVTKQGGVTSNMLYDWIKAYGATYGSEEFLPIKEGTISADLFEDDIDESRKVENERGRVQKGYSFYDFDADLDLQSWESWVGSNPSFWDEWREFGFLDALFGEPVNEENVKLPPIQVLDEKWTYGAREMLTDNERKEVSEKLYVNYNDVDELFDFYKAAIKDSDGRGEDQEMYVVLFRYATTDYYAADAEIIKVSDFERIKGQAYVAKQSVFFDFDIIQLTFNKNGVYTIIPVVASPIDVVNPMTPPADVYPGGCIDADLRKMLVIAVIAVIVIFIVRIIFAAREKQKVNVAYRAAKKHGKNRKRKK